MVVDLDQVRGEARRRAGPSTVGSWWRPSSKRQAARASGIRPARTRLPACSVSSLSRSGSAGDMRPAARPIRVAATSGDLAAASRAALVSQEIAAVSP